MSRPVLIAGLIVGCVTAAGVGSYLATRHVAQSAPAAAARPPSSTNPESDPGAVEPAASDGTTIDLEQDTSPAAERDPSGLSEEDSEREADRPTPEEPAPAPRAAVSTTAKADRADNSPERGSRGGATSAPPLEADEAAQSASASPDTERSPSDRPETTRSADPTAVPTTARAADAVEEADSSEEPVTGSTPPPPESRTTEPVATSAENGAGFELPEGIITPQPPLRTPVTVEPDAVVGLQIDNTVSSATAQIEDRVDAHATRDVLVDDVVAIPAGTRLRGSVVEVETGSRLKGGARLGVRFHSLVLADGTELPLRTETIYREGPSSSDKTTAKIGGATVGGAILGAILGGGKGAAIGAAAGAGGGTAAAATQRVEPAVLRAGSNVTVRLTESFTIEVEH